MREFRAIDDIDAMDDYLSSHASFIDDGIDRSVFDTGLGYVIKLAKKTGMFGSGVYANKAEIDALRCVPKLVVPSFMVYDKKFRWIAVEKVRSVSRSELNKLIYDLSGGEASSFVEFTRMVSDGRYDPRYAERYASATRSSEWFKAMDTAVSTCGITDIHDGNFGVTNDGRLVLIDMGVVRL